MSAFPDLIDLNDYISRVRFLIDENSEKNFSTGEITRAINIAARGIQNRMLTIAPDAGFFERKANLNPTGTPPGTVGGVQEYTLPSDFKRFKRVARGDNDVPLDPIDLNERYVVPGSLWAGLAPITAIGPRFYYVTGNAVGFVPVPDGAYPILMVYVYTIPLLQFGNDVSEVPLEYRDLMCVQAAIDCITKDEGMPANLERIFNRADNNLITTLGDRQIQMNGQVTRTGRSW